MKNFIWAVIFGLIACASRARAGVIDTTNVPVGSSNVDLGFATVSTATGTFNNVSGWGLSAIGVEGGVVPEIDSTERVTITFPTPTLVDAISIGWLFAFGIAPDLVNETVTIKGVGASTYTGNLEATSATTATWSGPGGPVAMIVPIHVPSSGFWLISNPFGNNLVTSIEFTALVSGIDPPLKDSDFGIASVVFTPTNDETPTEAPEPATLVMAGVGLLILGLFRRRA